jgi:ABC-type transport system involved in multi-copper enzyme maturation permease subunit
MLTRIKLTLKQHRFETIATVVLCLIAAVASFVEVYRLNSIQLPAGCTVGPRYMFSADSSAIATSCQLAIDRFNAIAWGADMGLVRTLLVLLPFIVGILFGAPLVAKEIEQGTAPLSWALVGSRRRWLLGKMFTAALLIVPLLLVAGLAADVLQGAQTPGTDPYASFENFSFRGVMIVFWGLAALFGTVALGTLIGRTLPAVLLALVVCFLARGFWDVGLNHTVLPPFAVMQSENPQDPQNVQMMYGQYAWTPSDLNVYYRTYLDGKPWDGDMYAWWNEHQPPMAVDPTSGLPVGVAVDTGPNTQIQGPYSVPFVIHGDRYWPIVALESGILFAGSLVFGAVALFWVDRRRPY